MNTNEKKQIILFFLLSTLLFNVWTLPKYRQFKATLRSVETMSNTIKNNTRDLHHDFNANWRAEQLMKDLRKSVENEIIYRIETDKTISIEIMGTNSIHVISNNLDRITEYDFIIKELNFITVDNTPRIHIVLDSFSPFSV